MSQCYHAELKESVCRIVNGEDSISYPIELTSILPQGEMAELLKDQLKQSGWTAENDEESIFVKEGSAGEELRIDLDEMEMTATITSEREVVSEATVHTTAESSKSAKQIAARLMQEEKKAVGDRIEDAANQALQKEVTALLAESEADRQRTMHELLQRVYAESLKQKAGQLGEIMEIAESTNEDGNYELTIRIEQ